MIFRKNYLFLSLVLLNGYMSVGHAANQSTDLGLLDLDGMVHASNPSDLGLVMRYDELAFGNNDLIGGYCHLYANNALLASAAMIRCFYFQNNLIIFLGDVNGYVEQIKVFKYFVNQATDQVDVCYKQYLPSAIYTPVCQDLLNDVEMVKLNLHQEPMAIIRAPHGRDILMTRIYRSDKLFL